MTFRERLTIFTKGYSTAIPPTESEIIERYNQIGAVQNKLEEETGTISLVDKGKRYSVKLDGLTRYDAKEGAASGEPYYATALVVEDAEKKSIAEAKVTISNVVNVHDLPQSAIENPEALRVMLKALEIIGIEARAEGIAFPVGSHGIQAAMTGMQMGFRVTGCDTIPGGETQLTMVKSLSEKPLPFDSRFYAQQVGTGKVAIAVDKLGVNVLTSRAGVQHANEIGLTISQSSNVNGELCRKLIGNGYVGIGFVPDKGPSGSGTMIFKEKCSAPTVAPLSLPISVSSDYGRLREVVLSHTPYVIPAISPNSTNNSVARAARNMVDALAISDEHAALVAVLEANGVIVSRSSAWIQDINRIGIFARDPSFVIGDTVVIGKMLMENRQYEAEAILQLCVGKKSVRITGDASLLEGGDVIELGGGLIAVGLNERTNRQGLQELRSKFPNYTFIGVEHEELHLDVILTSLGEKKVLANVSLLPVSFLQYLNNNGYTIVAADPSEQASLGPNVLAIDESKVVAVKENKSTNARLRAAGITVIEVSMPNITKKGGGVRCITFPTNRE